MGSIQRGIPLPRVNLALIMIMMMKQLKFESTYKPASPRCWSAVVMNVMLQKIISEAFNRNAKKVN